MIQACSEGLTAEALGKGPRHRQEQPNCSWGLAAPPPPVASALYSYMQLQSPRGPLGWILKTFWCGYQTARETKRLWQMWAFHG